jgi:hypothetical protein
LGIWISFRQVLLEKWPATQKRLHFLRNFGDAEEVYLV